MNLIHEETLSYNKEVYKNLLLSICPEAEALFEVLNSSDFFTAPATVRYNSSFEGGLCYHTLQVYTTMVELNEKFNFGVSPLSILKVGLLHEIGKIGYYEQNVINKKVYDDDGDKKDELGRFYWQSTRGYKVKEDFKHVGSIGLRSYLIANEAIQFTQEETMALLNYNSLTDKNTPDCQSLLANSKLLTLLHTAILISRYVKENLNA